MSDSAPIPLPEAASKPAPAPSERCCRHGKHLHNTTTGCRVEGCGCATQNVPNGSKPPAPAPKCACGHEPHTGRCKAHAYGAAPGRCPCGSPVHFTDHCAHPKGSGSCGNPLPCLDHGSAAEAIESIERVAAAFATIPAPSGRCAT
jgi:hypothetical protein